MITSIMKNADVTGRVNVTHQVDILSITDLIHHVEIQQHHTNVVDDHDLLEVKGRSVSHEALSIVHGQQVEDDQENSW